MSHKDKVVVSASLLFVGFFFLGWMVLLARIEKAEEPKPCQVTHENAPYELRCENLAKPGAEHSP